MWLPEMYFRKIWDRDESAASLVKRFAINLLSQLYYKITRNSLEFLLQDFKVILLRVDNLG